ncbi:MAG: helix-turn-helix domain-containing protein, partial [Christensenellaceae bacterium]
HECILYDQQLALTPIEFNILWMLAENRGQVISAERLFEGVWGEKYLDRNNTVMVHIRRLREKMNDPSRNPRFIKTVWGVGYKIE